ncbi:MAG: hypothetical protein ACRDIY_22645 [Chloroflexota bacterium]
MVGQASRSCGWCHTFNRTTVRFCRRSGHEAHVARTLCRCPSCAARPGVVTRSVQCQYCGAFIAWGGAATRESLENPSGEKERWALAEFLHRVTDGESQRVLFCAPCRHSASGQRPPDLRDGDCQPSGGV